MLDLVEDGPDRFRGKQPHTSQQRVFGGQVVGQALAAAERTAPEGMASHSLHAYFLRGGDPAVEIEYAVDRVRDGRSFATRRVLATQHDRPIYATMVNFHIHEDGYDHQDPMPDVPQPEDCEDYSTVLKRQLGSRASVWIDDWGTLDLRHAGDTRGGIALDNSGRPAVARLWLKVPERIPDDSRLHREMLAYLSDLTLLGAAMLPHGAPGSTSLRDTASLDHAVWFHRPFRVDEWLLFAQHSPTASDARGLIRGEFYTRAGVLVASVMQEALIRRA